MSHHLDSPLARQDVRLEITYLCVFRGETGTVLAINVCHSLAGDIPTSANHPEGRYEFKIDLDHDGVEDLTYQRDALGRQNLTEHRTTGAAATDPFAAGAVVTTGETLYGDGGLRVLAGKAGDPFWIEPDVLHAVGHTFRDGTTIDLRTWTPDQATNLFAGHTEYSIVLEIPDAELLDGSQPTRPIDVWAVASLATDAGGWRSINRFGLPMIHPLFTQFNEKLGDDLNSGRPSDDLETYGKLLTLEIAAVVRAYGTAVDPEAYASAVARRFLPNMLPYVVGTPASFGFNSWSGRSLTDNAPNVMLSIAPNTPVSPGIGKESVTSKPRDSFSYVPAAS